MIQSADETTKCESHVGGLEAREGPGMCGKRHTHRRQPSLMETPFNRLIYRSSSELPYRSPHLQYTASVDPMMVCVRLYLSD